MMNPVNLQTLEVLSVLVGMVVWVVVAVVNQEVEIRSRKLATQAIKEDNRYGRN